MTAPSAYPPAIDALMPRAIELTKTLDGELPSRNRLMKALRIGSEKANAVLIELGKLAEQQTPRPPLTLVPAPDPDTPDGPAAPVESVVTRPADPVDPVDSTGAKPVTWPVFILCLPAFVAIWGGWVEMGRLTGFGKVTLLPGILDRFQLNTAITLPIGVETYAAYALFVWLSGRASGDARAFAKWSALASLLLGGLGQVAYHLMNAAGWTSAPWPITAAVSCIPVAVLGMGAALAHLMHRQ